MSSAIRCDRSPRATAPSTRLISAVGWVRSVIEHVDGVDVAGPAPLASPDRRALPDPPVPPDDGHDAPELGGGALVQLDDVVERLGDLSGQARPVTRQADVKSPLRTARKAARI